MSARTKSWILPLATAACLSGIARSRAGEGHGHPSANELFLRPGMYYPGPYYSRAYIQEFPLRPGQQILYYQLRPYQHYGEHRLGVPTPGLTTGSVQSDFFPYRYVFGFQPIKPARPLPPDDCTPPPPGFSAANP